jgi:chromosome segregation ATPase
VRFWATRLAIVALVVVGGYLVYEFGRIQAGYDLVDAASERRDYEQHIEMLEDEISGLKEQVAMLETHRDIDREAYREVEASLTELQAKIQEQRDAIAFYRGIVSPADGNKGLRVQDLKLTRGKNEREYNIRLVLVQALKHDRKVSGNVNLTIEGDLDGVEKTFSYAELLPEDNESAWAFSFRYFQDFNRQVVLPDGFTPQRVKVEVQSKTRSISSIEESFAWTTSQG